MHADTQDFLTAAGEARQTHHAVLRNAGLAFVRKLNTYRAAAVELQTKLQTAELSETDEAVSGKFHELADQLRTADRLCAAAAVSVNELTRHLARIEATQAGVT